MSKSSKKVKRIIVDTLKGYYDCDSVEDDVIGDYKTHTYRVCYTIWYGPCGAPDSE